MPSLNCHELSFPDFRALVQHVGAPPAIGRRRLPCGVLTGYLRARTTAPPPRIGLKRPPIGAKWRNEVLVPTSPAAPVWPSARPAGRERTLCCRRRAGTEERAGAGGRRFRRPCP